MDKLKKNIDKIAALTIVGVCAILIVRTHLFGSAEAVAESDIKSALERVREAMRLNVPAPKPKLAVLDELERNLRPVELAAPPGLAAWKFFPRKEAGEPPPRNYTVEAAYKSSDDARTALAAVRNGKMADPASSIGGKLFAGRFLAPEDPAADALCRKLRAGGDGLPAADSCKVIMAKPPPPPVIGSLQAPTVSAVLSGVGRVTVTTAFSKDDKYWATEAMLIWRRRVGDEWKKDPDILVTRTRTATEGVGGGVKAAVEPAGAAEVSADGATVTIVHERLESREAYEYRAGTEAVFLTSVQEEGKDECEVLPPRADSGVAVLEAPLAGLKGRVYGRPMSDAAKVAIPGDVQIQFSGTGAIEGKPYASFNMRRLMPGGEKVRIGAARFNMGQRLKAETTARVGGKFQKVTIDAEMELVEVVPDKRPNIIERRETRLNALGQLETVIVPVEGDPITVEVAVLKNLRTGEEHRLDKISSGKDIWWPEIPAIIMSPAPKDKPEPKQNLGPGALPPRRAADEPDAGLRLLDSPGLASYDLSRWSGGSSGQAFDRLREDASLTELTFLRLIAVLGDRRGNRG